MRQSCSSSNGIIDFPKFRGEKKEEMFQTSTRDPFSVYIYIYTPETQNFSVAHGLFSSY